MIKILEENRWLAIILTLISASLIFYISSITFPAGDDSLGIYAIIYHFTAFSYLTLFLLISLTKGKLNKPLIIMGIILTLIYGISDEVHQLFVPGRFASIKDIIINSFGILLTSLAYSNYIKNH
jgi:ABC-type enterochelin transport system permease subunit